MRNSQKLLATPIRWLFLAALIATLGFAFSAQLSQNKSYADDTARLIIAEVQEIGADTDPVSHLDDTNIILSYAPQLQFSSNLNPHHLFYSEFSPSLALLHPIRPRSPPLSKIS